MMAQSQPHKKQCSWELPEPGIWLLSPILIVLLACIVLNIYVNPLSLYWSQRFKPAEVNRRAQKYQHIKQLAVPPETIIQGSSRTMTIWSVDVDRFLEGECYNASGLGARAEDYYAGLRLLCEDGGIPVRRMVLGIDFEAFCPKVPTMSEARYFPQYQKYLIRSPVSHPSLAERLSLLVSMQQTNEAFSVLRKKAKGQEGPTKELGPRGETLQSKRDNAIAQGTFDLDAVLARRLRKYPLQSLHIDVFDKPDPLRIAYLEDLLDYCQEHDIEVYAFITPYHPKLWEIINPLPVSKVLDQVRIEVEGCFSKRGLIVHDFSHIEAFGGTAEAFYDEVHMQRTNQQRLLDKLFSTQPPMPGSGAQ